MARAISMFSLSILFIFTIAAAFQLGAGVAYAQEEDSTTCLNSCDECWDCAVDAMVECLEDANSFGECHPGCEDDMQDMVVFCNTKANSPCNITYGGECDDDGGGLPV